VSGKEEEEEEEEEEDLWLLIWMQMLAALAPGL
jgi:hypothetical protein